MSQGRKYDALRLRLQQKDAKIRHLTEEIEANHKVNDAKNLRLSQLQSDKFKLECQIQRTEHSHFAQLAGKLAEIGRLQQRIQALVEQNISLSLQLKFCSSLCIFLCFVALVHLLESHVFKDRPITKEEHYYYSTYLSIKEENEELIQRNQNLTAEITGLKEHASSCKPVRDDLYSQIKTLQRQRVFLMAENAKLKGYLERDFVEPELSVDEAKEQELKRQIAEYELLLEEAQHEIARLKKQKGCSGKEMVAETELHAQSTACYPGVGDHDLWQMIFKGALLIIGLATSLYVHLIVLYEGNPSEDKQRQEIHGKRWRRGSNGRLTSVDV